MASWNERLKERWKVKNTYQVVLILIVFACTGTTVALIARPVLHALFAPNDVPAWATVLYYVLILPIYNIFLLFYGLIFGQFRFFWEFERRFFGRIFNRKPKQ
jgi:O-antigen/teichoic acid export membrane protein